MSRRKLTPEQEVEIVRRYLKGEEIWDLAKEFEITWEMIQTAVKKHPGEAKGKVETKQTDTRRTNSATRAYLGTKRRFTPQQERQIAQLYQEGSPMNEILKRFDIYKPLLYTILRRHGLSPSRRKQRRKSPPGTFVCTMCGKIKPLSQRCDDYNICLPCRRKRAMKALMKDKYNISEDEYSEMLARQDGKCAVCGKKFDLEHKYARSIHIDHSHKTGKFRGLLCSDCNLGLGRFKDDPKLLATAIAYLLDKEPS